MKLFGLAIITILIESSCVFCISDDVRWSIDHFDDLWKPSENLEQTVHFKNLGAYVAMLYLTTKCYNVKSGQTEEHKMWSYQKAVNDDQNLISIMSRPDWTCRGFATIDVMFGNSKKYNLKQCEDVKVTAKGTSLFPKANINYSGCAPNGVALYEHSDYKGTEAYFIEGDYTLDGMKTLGFKNDQVSSIKVPQGYQVEIFEHNNYGGSHKIITEDNNRLSLIGFNDRIGSIQVRKLPDFIVGLYEHCKYMGMGRYFEEGKYLLNEIQASGLKNDQISSIKVPNGYQVEVFEHNNYHGSSTIITKDTSCLLTRGFNDKIGSVKVKKIGVLVKLSCSDDDTFLMDLEPGKYTISDLEDKGIPSNSISSIEIGKGFKLTLYSDNFFEGESTSFTKTNKAQCLTRKLKLEDQSWETAVSSLWVEEL